MRKLRADEIECRVAQTFEKGCALLLYKTARVDRAILDEVFGEFNWQNDFKVIDGKMYGGIGVKRDNEWIWRWDCGTESNTEKEKGEASDCFKRAGFKWGIGVELYTAPFIWYSADMKKNDKGKWELKNKYTTFSVKKIDYTENGDIKDLVIVDNKGNQVFKTGQSVKPEPKPVKQEVDPDMDLIEGLKACATYSELSAYYKNNFENVTNKKAFNELVAQLKENLKGK